MSAELFDLSGKTALITGSSQGIGYALAEGLAKAGAQIILNGRNAAKLEKAASALGAKALAFNVTDHAAVRMAVDGFDTATTRWDVATWGRIPREPCDPSFSESPSSFASIGRCVETRTEDRLDFPLHRTDPRDKTPTFSGAFSSVG